MSLPRDLLDQLLTGYLDDTLSADELTRVQQLLETDDAFAAELATYQQIRLALKSVAKTDSQIRLPSDFANRVLDAAVARARDEGLTEDHPLVRLVDQPSPSRSSRMPASSVTTWQAASILVGLAASIAIAVVVLRPKNDLPGEQGLAALEVPGDTQDPELANLVDPGSGQDEARPLTRPDTNSIVSAARIVAVDGTPEAVGEDNSTVAEPALSAVDTARDLTPRASDAPVDSIATIESTPEMPTSESPAAADPPSPAGESAPNQLALVMVLDVRLTDLGRANDTIDEALRYANLASATRKQVSDELAEFTKNQVVDPGSSPSTVLYLQGPAKSIDRFYLRLLSEVESVESVGMVLSMDGPVQRIANSFKPDPTDVQHPDVSIEIFGTNEVLESLAGELGRLPFKTLSEGIDTVIPSIGPDVQSQVLVLVR